ncbi:MAG: hypothetical protein LUH05_04210 [Candidatus Gastranaerophilales bacterium]|nr:hypothetical protein [Candidatus Gastranaerophilales bacterium]
MYLREKVKCILKKDAEKIADFVEEMYEYFPEQVEKMINEQYYGCHLKDEEVYEKAVSYLVNPDGSKGAKWDVDEIIKKSGIDISEKDYTELDYAYIVNMLYSDYGSKIKDPDIIMSMAELYLEDKDYPGEASERAYCDAKKRIKYFMEK